MSGMTKWEHLKLPFKKIKEATNDFAKLIGRGGYGRVYEGKLLINGKYIKVAVKRLNDELGQGLKEFLTEIDLLSGRQHENLITLVGYCDEGIEKIVIYEYAEHGSLDRYIRCGNATNTLTWLERLQIVVGAARGLDHLHNHLGGQQFIIHRDIKSSNILLDDNRLAKISDFGLSKSGISGFNRSTVISHACGTPTYLEPEYLRTGLVAKKSDVYSFGMVLFEILCGRLSYVRDKDGIMLLADVAKEYYTNNELDKIIFPSLRKQMSLESFRKFSTIAYKCLQSREQRPSIEVVKKELEETLKLQTKSLLVSSEGDIIDDEYLKKQLPNRYQRYIQRSDKPLHYANKKELYHTLCMGFLCDNSQMWISLCILKGKICSMLPATEMLFNDNEYESLETLSLSESRFPEVKVLGSASSYSLECTPQLQMVSPQSTYACYLVFKFSNNKQGGGNHSFTTRYGLDHIYKGQVLAHMSVLSTNKSTTKTNIGYDLESWMEERNDGWMEIMLTKPIPWLEKYSKLKVELCVLDGSFKGIIVEGIEFRPSS